MLPALLVLMLASDPAPLSLEEAERIALDQSPDVRTANQGVVGALADVRSERGGMLPKLHVDGQLQYWGSPYSINFLSELPPQFTSLLPPNTSIPPTTVRDATTSTLSVTLSQPLTQLWGQWRQLDADRLAREAALAHLDAAGRDLLFAVRQDYFRLLQAFGNAGIARDSVEQLESHVAVAKEQYAAGTLVKADLLRSEVQLGQARQDLVKANATLAEAQATLDQALDRPSDQPIVAVDPFGDGALPEPKEGLEALTEAALQSRPDVREADLRREQAEVQVDVAWSQLVPGVTLSGQYEHTTGQLFFATDQAYVGGTLSWDVWDWGAKYYAMQSARARAAQSAETLRSTELRLRTQVENAWQELTADRDALKLAAEVVDQAEESFRLETERYRAQTATSTDLLDAQAALSQAKLRLTNARYDYLTELAQLEDLVGEPLLGR
ncbi:MAG TPA: TolC family protein [Myxococcales bacterium]|nr:TolC family protein [Myxococcales bacterium]